MTLGVTSPEWREASRFHFTLFRHPLSRRARSRSAFEPKGCQGQTVTGRPDRLDQQAGRHLSGTGDVSHSASVRISRGSCPGHELDSTRTRETFGPFLVCPFFATNHGSYRWQTTSQFTKFASARYAPPFGPTETAKTRRGIASRSADGLSSSG